MDLLKFAPQEVDVSATPTCRKGVLYELCIIVLDIVKSSLDSVVVYDYRGILSVHAVTGLAIHRQTQSGLQIPNSKVMSSLLLVRKCFLASSPLGRHSLELRASVSRVFANRSRLAQDPILYWRSVFAAMFSSS